MTSKSPVCRLPRGSLPLGAASRGGCTAGRTVWCGDPIAESLWPTLPVLPAGPFQPWRLRGLTALSEQGFSAPRLPRVPCNLYAANGFPVSACSLTLVLPCSRSIRTWPAMAFFPSLQSQTTTVRWLFKWEIRRECLKLLLLRAGQFRGDTRRKPVKLSRDHWPRNAQFTNLRMRTFIAVPSARKVNNTDDPP
jgi:hypothetical protein